MKFGFHFAFHHQTQRNGLDFHNFSLVKSRLVKCANEYVCNSHSTKYPHNNNKPLTSAIIFEKFTDTNPMVFGAGEEMFEISNYNTAAQNLAEIEVTPADDYSQITATTWENLPTRPLSMREMKIVIRSPQGTRHTPGYANEGTHRSALHNESISQALAKQ